MLWTAVSAHLGPIGICLRLPRKCGRTAHQFWVSLFQTCPFLPKHTSRLAYEIARPGRVTHQSSLLLRVFAFAAKDSGLPFLLPTKEHFLECNLTDQFSSIHRRYISMRKIDVSLSAIKKEIWTTYSACCNSKKNSRGWLETERLSKL